MSTTSFLSLSLFVILLNAVDCDESLRLSIQRASLERLLPTFLSSLQTIAPKIPMESGEEFDNLLREMSELISTENSCQGLVAGSLQLSEFLTSRSDLKEVVEMHNIENWGIIRDFQLISLKIKYEELPSILALIVDPTTLEGALDIAKEDYSNLNNSIKALKTEVGEMLKNKRHLSFETRMANLAPIFAKYESTVTAVGGIAIGDYGSLEQFVTTTQNTTVYQSSASSTPPTPQCFQLQVKRTPSLTLNHRKPLRRYRRPRFPLEQRRAQGFRESHRGDSLCHTSKDFLSDERFYPERFQPSHQALS
ncbi:hypothetical protein L596_026118 [Steinernema carpocapsae]|uniref:Uncharacterized protein n=1 Tax=Steinernema carpocapsae TaxID=34508 RepID=A0A4U5M0E1_STECR|nr:hypothetical protein L596_026118 [Steinernema carpocapsae]